VWRPANNFIWFHRIHEHLRSKSYPFWAIYLRDATLVTLYFEQWNKLLTHADELRTFLLGSQQIKIKAQGAAAAITFARIPFLLSRAVLAWLTLILITPFHRYHGKSMRVRGSVHEGS
jgi:hypothetical protein